MAGKAKLVRVPDALLNQVKSWAAYSGASLNGIIVRALDKYMSSGERKLFFEESCATNTTTNTKTKGGEK